MQISPLAPLSPTDRQRILDSQHTEQPASRGTLSVEARTQMVLAHHGQRLGLSPMQTASILLNAWADDQLRGNRTDTPTERIQMLLRRYRLNVLTADQLLPMVNPSKLLNLDELLKFLKLQINAPYKDQPENLMEVHTYIEKHLGVPAAWLLGESMQPAVPWPSGFGPLGLGLYVRHREPLLLIKPITISTQSLLTTPNTILVAQMADTLAITEPIPTTIRFRHISPLGTVDLSQREQRRSLMAAILARADENGINTNMRSTNVSAEMHQALQSGDIHPDDHIQDIWNHGQTWNAYRLTVTNGVPSDVEWISAEDKAAARALLNTALTGPQLLGQVTE